MNAVQNYFSELSSAFTNGWNRFWFEPRDPAGTSLLRILVGCLSLYFLASHAADLSTWFGPNGLLPTELVRQPEFVGPTVLDGASITQASFHISYLSWIENEWLLAGAHLAAMLIALAFTLGLFSRVTNILTALIVLSYVHRAPMITGQFEPVLTLMLVYLCLAPSGARLSLDRWLERRSGGHTDNDAPSWTATLSQRLIQVHIAGLYFVMALTKLAGDTWWAGDATWWLMAHTESRLIDLTFVHGLPALFNGWTHSIVLFELVFPLLVWNRLARPLLLVLAFVMWVPLALVTGLIPFFAAMLIANLSYVRPSVMRSVVDKLQGLLTPSGKESGKSAKPADNTASSKSKTPVTTSQAPAKQTAARQESLEQAAALAGQPRGC